MTDADSVGFIEAYLAEIGRTVREIDRTAVARAIDILFATWRSGGAVYVMGNGGSASTASHLAADLAKYTIVSGKPRFRAMGLTDNAPLVSAWTNDSGFGSIFVEQLRPWLQAGDALIGLSVHGGSGSGEAGPWSQNLIQAIDLAHARDARVIGMSGFDGGALGQLADVCILVPIDQEPMGTPVIESVEVALHHLICGALRARIQAEPSTEASAALSSGPKEEGHRHLPGLR